MVLMNQLVGICLYTDVYMCAQLLQLALPKMSVQEMLTDRCVKVKLPLENMRNLVFYDIYKFVTFKPLIKEENSNPHIAVLALLSLIYEG